MRRTTFTLEDIRYLIEQLFNGNLTQYKASNGTVRYENANSEQIILVDEEDGTETKIDLAEYLNLKFYAVKERLVQKGSGSTGIVEDYDSWLQSINFSMNESYVLVEQTNEEAVASQDIDSGTISGTATFFVQTDKLANLEYYCKKIRAKYLGNAETLQNRYGDNLSVYLLIGILLYDQEPTNTPLGECVKCYLNFAFTYNNSALTYDDTKIEISLDGDDEYGENGEILGETKFLQMPIIKIVWQNNCTSQAIPTASRPDLTGFLGSALTTIKTITFFDFNQKLTLKLNDLFWKIGAYRIDGKLTEKMEVNIPVYLRITSNGHTYVYKDMIDNMQKSIVNSDFNTSSITLKGFAKKNNEVNKNALSKRYRNY